MKLLSDKSNNVTQDFNDLDKEDVIGVLNLQMQLLIEEDVFASFDECVNMWARYSNNLAASWLIMPKSGKDILAYIKSDDFFVSLEDSARCFY